MANCTFAGFENVGEASSELADQYIAVETFLKPWNIDTRPFSPLQSSGITGQAVISRNGSAAECF